MSTIWTPAMWDRYQSRGRYLRDIINMPFSRLLRRVFPQLMVLAGWSCMALYLSSHHVRVIDRIQMPLTPLSLISTFIGALLTLRSNQGLSRLTEGRLIMGQMVLHTREFALLLASYVYPKDPKVALVMGECVALLGPSKTKGLDVMFSLSHLLIYSLTRFHRVGT